MIADRQTHTHRQTGTIITILRSPIGGGVMMSIIVSTRNSATQRDCDILSTAKQLYKKPTKRLEIGGIIAVKII